MKKIVLLVLLIASFLIARLVETYPGNDPRIVSNVSAIFNILFIVFLVLFIRSVFKKNKSIKTNTLDTKEKT